MCWPSLYRHSADRLTGLTGDSPGELHKDPCHNQQWGPAFPNIHNVPLSGTGHSDGGGRVVWCPCPDDIFTDEIM